MCEQVPKQCLSADTVVEDVNTGCRGCASGAGGNKNIFGNKYGQYLAAIQASVARLAPSGISVLPAVEACAGRIVCPTCDSRLRCKSYVCGAIVVGLHTDCFYLRLRATER